MDAAIAFWHFANFFAAAVGLGLIASAAAKLLWRGPLRGVSVLTLWAWTAGACASVSIAGLVVFGRDGKMTTYAAMVIACSAVLWWFSRLRGR